jgi:hypothetical protein
MTSQVSKLPYHPLLGRNINHDDASKQFPAEKEAIKNIVHERVIPILNQLQLGKCTCEAMAGLLGTAPFFTTLPPAIQAILNTPGNDENEADWWTTQLYEQETKLEDPSDAYPPNDPGGSGLYVMKCAKADLLVKNYTHAFGLDHAVRALALRPVIIGIPWYNSMFTPDSNNCLVVDFDSGLAGGHELVLRGIDFSDFDTLDDPKNMLIGDNSWDTSWGDKGSFTLKAADFDKLLQNSGDVTTATPLALA